METIKVNMSPNPLDVQTIHASQNDTEARQWEFELHNNGELIDTSEITEQLFFKAYKGGTEQLLPENGSTPTTSPFKGDIRYPQGLLTDQEFTYRQSPTEEDGLAKITDIKGNTLVWNQLVQNGNFASSSGWGINGGTLAVANNIATLTANSSVAYVQIYRDGFKLNTNHRYLIKFNYNATNITNFLRAIVNSTDGNTYVQLGQNTSNSGTFNVIVTPSLSATRLMFAFVTNGNASGSGTISNVQLFDLTQMGLDISNPSDFTSLFPLSYYSYNQGSLLSFNGNGIKTVGKNLNPWEGVNYTAVTSRTIFLKKGDYVISTDNGNNFEGSTQIYFCLADSNGNNITSGGITSGFLSLNDSGTFYYGGYGRNNIPFTLNLDAFVSFGFNNRRPTNINEIQLEFGSTATDYEPYTSSTLSLPISTYFPNGMNGFDGYYDVLTENKAVKGIDTLDLGTKNYIIGSRNTDNTGYTFYFQDRTMFQSAVPIRCTKFTQNNNVLNWESLKLNECLTSSSGYFVLCADYNDVASLKNALQGVYLYYPLATPTETSFTTASLVTENAEITLSNNDGVLVGKCTEQLSENPGFIDAKIKLSDSDGECYSNKIQLHVERSPQ